MIAIVATISVRPDKVEEFEAAARELQAKVKENEPDCLLYRMAKSRSEPGVYKNLEMFVDQAALDSHIAADYFLAITPRLGACVAAESDVHFLDTLD